MSEATTNCKGCTFAEYSEHPNTVFGASGLLFPQVQTGCRADRIDLFKVRHEAAMTVGQPYYNLSKFCNMYRGSDWVDLNGDDKDKARREIMPLFGIAIYDHPSSTLEDLQRTVDSVLAMDYPVGKMKLVISTFDKRGANEVSNMVNVIQETMYTSCAIFHVIDTIRIRDSDVFNKLIEAAYFVNIKSGSVLPPDIFNIIDKSQNDEVLSNVMYEGDGFSIIHKVVVNNLYLEHRNYKKMVDSVRVMSQEQKLYQKYETK